MRSGIHQTNQAERSARAGMRANFTFVPTYIRRKRYIVRHGSLGKDEEVIHTTPRLHHPLSRPLPPRYFSERFVMCTSYTKISDKYYSGTRSPLLNTGGVADIRNTISRYYHFPLSSLFPSRYASMRLRLAGDISSGRLSISNQLRAMISRLGLRASEPSKSPVQ
ncbi:MAG: hypothetical protein Athens041674_617 [Parcubacteria group bacterium Athens0416_74]|nr:MAG: hypothetical protein Athens041674_617 [Parcubacteria group bacterium Athens0416_74]